MFDELVKFWNDYLRYLVVGALIVGLLMFALYKVTTGLPIKVRQMDNGVTCYTFNDSLDCLQVDR